MPTYFPEPELFGSSDLYCSVSRFIHSVHQKSEVINIADIAAVIHLPVDIAVLIALL
jgi:hypothetical protein